MIKVIKKEKFITETLGGRPCELQLHIYKRLPFDCGCGKEHKFDPYVEPLGIGTMKVLRELPILKLVILNKECGYVTLVKIKGIFSYRLESIFSCKD
jgi:hypothetical protein